MEMDSPLGYLANDGLSICKQTPATNSLQVIKSELQLLDQVPPGVDGPPLEPYIRGYIVYGIQSRAILVQGNAMIPSEAHSPRSGPRFLQND